MQRIVAGVVGAFLMLVAIILEGVLLPHLQPYLTPVVPTMGEAISSTMAGYNEGQFTTAIRYAAAGYGEPGDVLLTMVSLGILFSVGIAGAVALRYIPRPIEPPRKRYAFAVFGIVGLLMWGYLLYPTAVDVSARITAMKISKLYDRQMAVLAPYISPQEARELLSQRARMHSRADLQAMDARVHALLQQYSLIPGSPPATPSP